MKKVSKKGYESSKADKAKDKKLKLKEGSKKDKKLDAKKVKKLKK